MKPEEQPHPPEKKTKYFYFLDSHQFESDTSSVSGATIRAKLPAEKANYAIYLEGHGNDPDQQVADYSGFSLETKPPLRFYSVPPANFGRK